MKINKSIEAELLCSHTDCKAFSINKKMTDFKCKNAISWASNADDCPIFLRKINDLPNRCQYCTELQVNEDFNIYCDIHMCEIHFENFGCEDGDE